MVTPMRYACPVPRAGSISLLRRSARSSPVTKDRIPVTVHVRAATAADREFMVGIVPRLRSFGPPPLRPAEALDTEEAAALERALDENAPDAILLIAELEGVGPAGVAYAVTATDYFTHEKHGHLSIIIVSAEGEGRGVGRAPAGSARSPGPAPACSRSRSSPLLSAFG